MSKRSVAGGTVQWVERAVAQAAVVIGVLPFFFMMGRPDWLANLAISIVGILCMALVFAVTRIALRATLGFKPDEAYAPFRAEPKPKARWQSVFPVPTETKRNPSPRDLILPSLATAALFLTLNLAFPILEQTLPRTQRLAIFGLVVLCNVVVVYQLWLLVSTFGYSFSRASVAAVLAEHRLKHVCAQYEDCDETTLNAAIQVTEQLYGNEFDRLHRVLRQIQTLDKSDSETLLQEASSEFHTLIQKGKLDGQDKLLLDFAIFVEIALGKADHAQLAKAPRYDIGSATPAPSSILSVLEDHLEHSHYEPKEDEAGNVFRERVHEAVNDWGEPTWLERKCLALFDRGS